jgi:bleomycin hydrolase
MNKEITLDTIQSFRHSVEGNPRTRLAINAVTRNKVIDVAMNWNRFSQLNHTFSDQIQGEMKVTNQKKSGRCWGFAGLNLMRILMGRKYNLEEFEFSQNYFMFWDKLEKANFFLENVLKTLDESWDSRLFMHLLQNPIQDGGQWDMFVNLIEKYGVVPKTSMAESEQSSNSLMMNRLITRKLREFAFELRQKHTSGVRVNELRDGKEKMLKTIYEMLTINLGTPPKRFD